MLRRWPNAGTHPWVQLRRNPRNVFGDTRMLGATLNSNHDLYGFNWDGSTLSFESIPFTADTTVLTYECIDIAFSPFGSPLSYDYVLKIVNQAPSAWKIRLRVYSDNNIERLNEFFITLHDGSSSTQVHIIRGSYTLQIGDWYDLLALGTDYIAVTSSLSIAGTSFLYTYLEILIPDSGVYTLYKITFEAS